MSRTLLVGTATLDLVYTLDRYPGEDDEMRASQLRVVRGGNAANTAVVLAQLGLACRFAGVLADAPESAVIRRDFERHGVDDADCPLVPGQPPTSSIYLTGQHRTIVHYRDLPELTCEQFSRVSLDGIGWVHFEGRQIPELLGMIRRVRSELPHVLISVELEKPRPGIEKIYAEPDVLICSRGFAGHLGHDRPLPFLGAMHRLAPQARLAVAWGEEGAYGLELSGAVVCSPAFPPERVVDTLGAGDTFNAGLIHGLGRGLDLETSIGLACRLAGQKCGRFGLQVNAVEMGQQH